MGAIQIVAKKHCVNRPKPLKGNVIKLRNFPVKKSRKDVIIIISSFQDLDSGCSIIPQGFALGWDISGFQPFSP